MSNNLKSGLLGSTPIRTFAGGSGNHHIGDCGRALVPKTIPGRVPGPTSVRALLLAVAFGITLASAASAQQVQWIWSAAHQPGEIPIASCYFRKTFRMLDPERGQLQIAVNDRGKIYLNGVLLGTAEGSDQTARFDLTEQLAPGVNVVAIETENTAGNTAGLAAALVVREKGEAQWRMLPSDASWRATTEMDPQWMSVDLDDSKWGTCQIVRMDPASTAAEARPASTPNQLRYSESKKPDDAARDDSTPDKKSSSYAIADEFEVKTVVDDSVGSLIAMEFDEWGRLIASREGAGLVRIDFRLEADNPQRIKPICDQVQSCQGILSLNGNLFVTGQGPSGLGLYRLSDADRNGTIEQVKLLVKFAGSLGEHGPHGVALGPDGFLYVVIGNASGVDGKVAGRGPYTAPYEADIVPRIEDPGGHAVGVKAPGGTIARCRLDGTQVEIFAGGIRNAYDLAFDANAELFIHDSDMETDIGTKWYRPTSLFQVQAGTEVGWRSGWALFRSHQPDCVPPILETGRGSPTGAVVYNHWAFPQRYRNTIFLGDWSEGRILNVSLNRAGSSYDAKATVFLQSEPLNVTDLAVGPDGALYFCTGGRGTSGGVFRIAWQGQVPADVINPKSNTLKLLTYPQPQSAWARQAMAKLKIEMGESWSSTLVAAASDRALDPQLRVRALETMSLYGPSPDASLLRSAASDPEVAVRVRAAKLMGLQPRESVEADLVSLLADAHPWVRRVACESLARIGAQPTLDSLTPCLASADRGESFAARRLLETLDVNQWGDQGLRAENVRVATQTSLALMIAHPSKENGYKVLARASELLDGFIADDDFVSLLRAVQLALTEADIDPAKIPAFVEQMATEFPTKNGLINGELARILSFLRAPQTAGNYASYFARASDSPQDKLYVAMMLHTTAGQLEPVDRRAILLTIEKALAAQGAGGGYYEYLSNAAESLARRITREEVGVVLEHGAEWPHAMVAAFFLLPEKLSAEAITRLIEIDRAPMKRTDATTRKMKAGILAVLAESGHESAQKYLHEVWQNDELRRNDVALVLAQKPEGENWSYLVSSFPNLDADSAGEILGRLKEVNRRPTEAKQFRELIQLALRLKENGAAAAISLLEHWTRVDLGSGDADWQSAIQPWKAWYAREFPNDSPIATSTESRESQSWSTGELVQALGTLDEPADTSHGQRLFAVAQCAKCHRFGTSGESIGPDLTGIARRFTRNDIVEAIVHPSKTVSDQYRGKKITLTNGQTMNGLLTAGPDDTWIVLNASGERVRLPKSEVDEISELSQSTMPDGLLDKHSAADVADLIAYLQSDPNAQIAASSGEDRTTRR